MMDNSLRQVQPPRREAATTLLKDTFIEKTVLLHVSDGRAFRGTFLCVDDGMNVILANADELRPVSDSSSSGPSAVSLGTDEDTTDSTIATRWVGMVMVPGHHVQKIEIKAEASYNRHKSGWPKNSSLYI